MDRQIVGDVCPDRAARVAKTVGAVEAGEHREGFRHRVEVDEPRVEAVAKRVPDGCPALVRDPADDERGEWGKRGIPRRRCAHQVTPKCRAACTPERQPSSWNPQPWYAPA